MSRPHARYFDRWARHYDRDLGRFGYTLPDLFARHIPPLLPAAPRLLDVGIGTGLIASALKTAMPDATIAGTDISRRMLDCCRAAGISQDVHLCDASSQFLPFGERDFDAVMSAGVLEFIQNPTWFLAQAARVLKTNGVLVVAFETIESAGLYKPGILSGIIASMPDVVTVRRVHYTPLPRTYNKYLHNARFIAQMAERFSLNLIDRQVVTAYRRPNGDQVMHDILVFRKI